MEETSEKFPFNIQDLDQDSSTGSLQSLYGTDGYVQVGLRKYVLPNIYRNFANENYNMEVRKSDIFVASFPRSGTTWTQELVWMVTNDMDYEGAQSSLAERYKLIEMAMIEQLEQKARETKTIGYMKTHLPLSLLPPGLLESAKMVYVARDPRDVAVSYFHFFKLFAHTATTNFKSFWNLFIRNLCDYTPYFEHVKEAWNMRHHPNMLFLFYEDLSQDLPAAIRRVSEFFSKSYSEDKVQRLAQHLAFSNFKKNEAVTRPRYPNTVIDIQTEFVRKGKVGGWREYFDEEMVEQAENWITENLKDSDLKYPLFGKEQHEK